jgi:hypothetical protein
MGVGKVPDDTNASTASAGSRYHATPAKQDATPKAPAVLLIATSLVPALALDSWRNHRQR